MKEGLICLFFTHVKFIKSIQYYMVSSTCSLPRGKLHYINSVFKIVFKKCRTNWTWMFRQFVKQQNKNVDLCAIRIFNNVSNVFLPFNEFNDNLKINNYIFISTNKPYNQVSFMHINSHIIHFWCTTMNNHTSWTKYW